MNLQCSFQGVSTGKALSIRGRHGGGGGKRGGRKTSRRTPLPKRGFGPPSYGTFSKAPPRVLLLWFFLDKKIHDSADEKLFWKGPELSGGCALRYVFPHTFCTFKNDLRRAYALSAFTVLTQSHSDVRFAAFQWVDLQETSSRCF